MENPNILLPILKNGKYGLITPLGKIMVAPKFNFMSSTFNDGYITTIKIKRIHNINRWTSGYTDMFGKTSFFLHYDCISDFNEGLSKVRYNGLYGFIDKSLCESISPIFNSATDFNNGLAGIKINEKWGFINTLGDVVIEPKFTSIHFFNEDICLVGDNFNYGFIDKKGNYILLPQFSVAGPFSNGLAFVKNNDNKFGFIDYSGNLVIDFKFDSVRSFSDGFAAVSIEDKWGYINTRGEFITDLIYDYASSFSDDVAKVCFYTSNFDNKKINFIDSSGKEFLSFPDMQIQDFKNGYAEIINGSCNNYITKKGDLLF